QEPLVCGCGRVAPTTTALQGASVPHKWMQSQRDNIDMDLPFRLNSCIGNWRLQVVSRLEGGFRSEVFACTTSNGEEVVVKLAATAEEARAEAAALGAWDGPGTTIHLIATDFPHSALLLDRVLPATHLPRNH